MAAKQMSEIIKELRTKRGMSQLELAQAMGYKDRTTVAKLESGDNTLPDNKVERMASILGTTPDYLKNTLERQLDALDMGVYYKSDGVWVKDESYAFGLACCFKHDTWEVYKRTNAFKEVMGHFYDSWGEETKKSPDTLIDTEGLSEYKRALIDYVMSLSDDEARVLHGMFGAKPQSGK